MESKVNEYNFILSDRETDKDLFFGPLDGEKFIEIKADYPAWNMSHIMVQAKVFQTLNQASNCGWKKPIPKGFTDFRAGKNRTRITILNIG